MLKKRVFSLLMAIGLVFILSGLMVTSVSCCDDGQRKIKEVPIPWQTWEPIDGAVRDVIRLSEDFKETVVITRDWTYLPQPVELNDLTWDETDALVEEMGVETSVLWAVGTWPTWSTGWTTLPSVTLEPGAEVAVDIPVFVVETDAAVVLRYTVALESEPDEVVARVINEAVFEMPTAGQPVITGMLTNFDVHNNTGEDVDNFELDLYGVEPSGVDDWYQKGLPVDDSTWGDTFWYGGWGTSPDISKIDGGTEVKWKDADHPIPSCTTVHFGVGLKDNVVPESVRGHWTQLCQETWLSQWWWVLFMAIAVAVAAAVAWSLRGRRLPQLLVIALVPGIFFGALFPAVFVNIFGPNIFIAVPVAILVAIAVTLIVFLILSLVIPKQKSTDSSSQKALVETILLLIEELGKEIESATKELKDMAEKQKNMTEEQKKKLEEKKKKLEEQKKKLKELEERKIHLFLKKLEKELDTVEDEVTKPPEESEPEVTPGEDKPEVTPGEGESKGTE